MLDDAYIQYCAPTLITCGSFQSAPVKPSPSFTWGAAPPWKHAALIVGAGVPPDPPPPPPQETSPSVETAAARAKARIGRLQRRPRLRQRLLRELGDDPLVGIVDRVGAVDQRDVAVVDHAVVRKSIEVHDLS